MANVKLEASRYHRYWPNVNEISSEKIPMCACGQSFYYYRHHDYEAILMQEKQDETMRAMAGQR